MKLLREMVGFALIFLAWFNPLELEAMTRILIFILGFDAMSMAPKIGIFIIDYFFGFAWLGWTLLILVGAEAIATFLPLAEKIVKLVIKPIGVFAVSFLAFGLQPALIVAGIDLLLNIGIGK